MDKNGLLYIEKRPLPYWLIIWVLSVPLLWDGITDFLSTPDFVKYTADIVLIILLCVLLFRKTIDIEKYFSPLVILVISLFVYSLVLYIFNYQSVIYYLWGVRNNFRHYVLFFATVWFFRESDITPIFKTLDILFWLNFIITLLQFYVFGYKQDYLGGIFGLERGVNATTIIFFSIVISNSLIKFMEKKENFWLCTAKCSTALFVSALTELKFFFVFFIIILVMTAMLTSFSWRKLLIIALCVLFVVGAATLLVTLFGFEGFMSFESIWNAATQEYYSSVETVNRLSAITKLSSTVVPRIENRIFGFGLGNCDTSSFEICNTPFFKAYGSMKYNFFSIAFLFLEIGYVGLLLYVSFFVICCLLIRNRVKTESCDSHIGNVALIISILAITLVVYNSSLRSEAGYLVYFILALPFLKRETEETE